MAGMALPRPGVRPSSRVTPPQDNQAHAPPGSEVRLVGSSTWRQGSCHHAKTSVSRQAAARQHSQSLDFGSGGTVGYTEEKRRGHLQRASSGSDQARTELLLVTAGILFLPIIYGMMGGFYLGWVILTVGEDPRMKWGPLRSGVRNDGSCSGMAYQVLVWL